MKRLILMAIAAGVLAGLPLTAGHRRHKHLRHYRGPVVYRAVPVAPVVPVRPVRIGYWGAPDIAVLRSYYRPSSYQPIPAGFVLAPNRPIPPGLLRRMRPIPYAVERRLAPLPAGYGRGFIGGRAVIFNRGSSVAIDIATLF